MTIIIIIIIIIFPSVRRHRPPQNVLWWWYHGIVDQYRLVRTTASSTICFLVFTSDCRSRGNIFRGIHMLRDQDRARSARLRSTKKNTVLLPHPESCQRHALLRGCVVTSSPLPRRTNLGSVFTAASSSYTQRRARRILLDLEQQDCHPTSCKAPLRQHSCTDICLVVENVACVAPLGSADSNALAVVFFYLGGRISILSTAPFTPSVGCLLFDDKRLFCFFS